MKLITAFQKLFLPSLMCLTITTSTHSEMVIDTQFQSARVSITSISSSPQKIDFTVNQTRGWKVWWAFKVNGINPSEEIRLNVSTGGYYNCPDLPVYSTDGKSWFFFPGKDSGSRSGPMYYKPFKVNSSQCYFAWFVPFVPNTTDSLIASVTKACPFAKGFELCKSNRLQYPVKGIKISDTTVTGKKFGIWIQAKQHAWEYGSSWLCKGFADWACSNDSMAVQLRKKADITIIPIMDVDNGILGFGGKNETPRDHNRDWVDTPMYAEVKAAQAQLKALHAAGRLNMFIDLHNQGWDNNYYGAPFCMLGNDTKFKAALLAEIKTFPTNIKLPKSNLNTKTNAGPTASGWVGSLSGVMSTTIETNVAPPPGNTDQPPLYFEKTGHELGRAIARYFLGTTTISSSNLPNKIKPLTTKEGKHNISLSGKLTKGQKNSSQLLLNKNTLKKSHISK